MCGFQSSEHRMLLDEISKLEDVTMPFLDVYAKKWYKPVQDLTLKFTLSFIKTVIVTK